MSAFNIITFRCFLTLLFFAAPNAKAGGDENISLIRILADAQFKPHFPTERQLLTTYGKGVSETREGDVYHTFYISGSNLWVRCKIEGDNKQQRPLTEILITAQRLCSKDVVTKAAIVSPELKGVHVGDDLTKVLKQWGEPLRKYQKKLGAVTATVYEFFPDSLEAGSCLRFFVRESRVIGFSFSNEE